MRHGDNPRGGIEGNGWNKIRVDTMGALGFKELCNLPFTHDHSAHARPNNDSDAVGALFRHIEVGVSQRFLRSD